jgi:hypothetical protein
VPLFRCLALVSYLGNIGALEPHLSETTPVITLQIHHTRFYGVDMRTLSHSDLTMAWGCPGGLISTSSSEVDSSVSVNQWLFTASYNV